MSPEDKGPKPPIPRWAVYAYFGVTFASLLAVHLFARSA